MKGARSYRVARMKCTLYISLIGAAHSSGPLAVSVVAYYYCLELTIVPRVSPLTT